MAKKIRHTKNEMKTQRVALTRFQRFLPMLQLKKQQLQAEILNIDHKIEEKKEQENAILSGLSKWIKLFSESNDLDRIISLKRLDITDGNIAGVVIPVFTGISMYVDDYDLQSQPPWIDDAVVVVQEITRLRIEQKILLEQRRRISEELRTTSQRVNLFEKVKIPEAKENIRVIKIFLGDQQTAAVVRGKIAKNRTTRTGDAVAA
jgi:V/A-type H+-transporting ATPase subunit D